MNKEELKSLSREEMEKLLSNLYERFENVRKCIDLNLTGQSDTLVKRFKRSPKTG
jgi:hypothetical protein